MSFALRHGGREHPLGVKRVLIGRSEECTLYLDDPLASRLHAAIFVDDRQRVMLEDLGSRNGTHVNSTEVRTPVALKEGDRVRIGEQEILLVRVQPRPGTETLVELPKEEKTASFGILGTLADKALAMGNGVEAERIIGRLMVVELERIEGGQLVGTEAFSSLESYGLRLAQTTKKAEWVDYLFRLHAAMKTLMSEELVHELYELGRKVQGVSRAELVRYLGVLDRAQPERLPGERFLLSRLEGLSKILR